MTADSLGMSAEHRRLTLALLLSLVIHTWLLSLIFGGHGLWRPGFGFPWQERRIEAPDLRVALVPAPVTAAEPAVTSVAEPSQQARVEEPATNGPTLAPSVSRAPTAVRLAAPVAPQANPKPESKPRTAAATGAANAPLRADRSRNKAPPPSPAPAVIALERTDEDTWVVPATPAMPAPVIAAAPSNSMPETPTPSLPDAGDAARAQIDQEASERPVELAKLDRSKQEEQRQAEQLEAARQDAALQEAARAENARLETERQEAARQAAALQEAARQEAAQRDAARQEATRQEVAQREAARQEAMQREAARQEAARVEAQETEARREARLRAIGRQLDEEAARREAASRQLPSSSSARRYWLFGRTDPNAELMRYVEVWSRKIELNMTFDMIREAAKQPHTDPVVTVAIRSDGSVESVTFVRSSGVPAIDEAIRSIVDSQKPYQAFPPGLAREWDVILIRRTWYFDTAIRLY